LWQRTQSLFRIGRTSAVYVSLVRPVPVTVIGVEDGDVGVPPPQEASSAGSVIKRIRRSGSRIGRRAFEVIKPLEITHAQRQLMFHVEM